MSERSFSSDDNITGESARGRPVAPWILGGLVLILLSVLIALQAFGLWEVVPPDSASDTVLLYALSSLNFVAFIVFTFIFVRSLLKLRRERRERQLGSKIKARLIRYFIALSLLPITAMAVFSYLFFNRSMEKWFSRLPDDVAYEASRVESEAVTNQEQSLRATASMLAVVIGEEPTFGSERLLSNLVESGHLAAIEITSSSGDVLVKHEATVPPGELKDLEAVLATAVSSKGTDRTLTDGKGFDAVSVRLRDGRNLIVVPERRSDSKLAAVISTLQRKHNQLVAKQRRVRLLGLSTLGLLTLMQLFGVTWIAIHLARGIATPIKALAEASNAVARGDLSHKVTTIADDELALLAHSFNQMTAQLTENRRRLETNAAELQDKNLALEERRNYIETVLESLSTGVISLDEDNRVTTINAAASGMLRLDDRPSGDLTLAAITGAEGEGILHRVLTRARRMGRAFEQTELVRGSGQEGEAIPVALTAIALRGQSGKGRGVVLVIEDLSELLTAQRAAAWSEVARRMAHEIKNPLTPIQLSAERIARNFRRGDDDHRNPEVRGKNGDGFDARTVSVVEECTATITREVAGLKAMVNEFSRFARLPHARLAAVDLNEVVRQSVALYEDRLDGVRMDVHLARTLPPAMLDAEQLRRVFVNLIDNAIEALDESDERRITVATGHDPSRGVLLAEVSDTGHGIPRADLAKLFQPYFSTRGRGTGLGLAIVQKIITEHSGRIRAQPNHPCGSKFTLELPTIGT
jgi:two-component system nitrogen regulation sensor histidine kinase NtrY